MKLYRKLEDFPTSLRGAALSIGNFDGVHKGHQRIIHRLRFHARQLRAAAVVFTFDPHPVRLLRPDRSPPPLTWTDRKAELLSELGVDAILAFPTHHQFLTWSSDEFFQQIVVQVMGAQAIVEGPNFFFGRHREGTVETLQRLCAPRNIVCEIVAPLKVDGSFISSSRIRDLIRLGDVTTARHWLTHPYRIRGMVRHGDARGSQIGFPTANLDAIDTLIPANGVYSGRTHLNGQSHLCAIHIGDSPTFGEKAKKVEVHILNFEDSLYGITIQVDFLDRLRDIRHFDSIDDLRAQLVQDVTQVRMSELV